MGGIGILPETSEMIQCVGFPSHHMAGGWQWAVDAEENSSTYGKWLQRVIITLGSLL